MYIVKMFVCVYIHACWWINPLRLELAVLVGASDIHFTLLLLVASWCSAAREDSFYLFKFSACHCNCIFGVSVLRIKREPVSLFGISSKPEKRQQRIQKFPKKRLSWILYSEMVKKSSGSVSEGDHQQRNNTVSFFDPIYIHMSIIGRASHQLLSKYVQRTFAQKCPFRFLFFAIGNGQQLKKEKQKSN